MAFAQTDDDQVHGDCFGRVVNGECLTPSEQLLISLTAPMIVIGFVIGCLAFISIYVIMKVKKKHSGLK